jgi:ParB family chromosome partitioning protein
MQLEYHPYANIFPLLEGDAFDELVNDIREHGLQSPIIIYEDKILDGRNRYRAACIIAQEADEPAEYYYYTQPYIDADPMGHVLSLNLHRRHLSESQRAMVAANISENRGLDNVPIGQICPSNAAKMMNVSERTVKQAKRVKKNGVPELSERVTSGEITVSAAEEIAQLPDDEQEKIVEAKTEKKVASEKRKEKKSRAKINTPYNLLIVELPICEFCLDGNGGFCQSSGCALFKRRAPDFALDNFKTISENIVND